MQWNPRLIYADVTGFGEKGPDADLPGFDITSYWARSGLLSMTRDAGEPPTWPVAGSGDNATAVGLYSAIVTALYRRERTGKGSYVTTSLLAEGVWSASVSIQAALCEAKFFGPHDRKNPANAALNVYRASDGTWFVLIVTPDKLAAVAKAIGRADLLADPRFADPAKLIQNMPQLTAILDDVFGSQPMTHWYEVFNGVHVTFGAVRGPQEVVNDPQLRANDIIVPLEGAGGKLTSTISSPIQVHGVAKAPARRAPDLGEHNQQVLEQLGFSATEIDGLHTSGAVPNTKEREAAAIGSARASGDRAAPGRLFVLDLSGNRVLSVNPDGSDRKVIVHECRMPDGIAVDVERGHIYWTNMGVLHLNDGSIERADLDGRNRTDDRSPGRHVHAETAPARKEERQAVLVRPRRACASCAPTSTGRRSRRSWRRARATRRPGPDQTKWCVGIAVDAGSRTDLLDAKRPGQCGARAASSAPASKFPTGRARPIDRTSKSFSTVCPSRSIWSSI